MSWWKRNRVPLAVVAILAPATIISVGWHEWIDYFSGRPVFAEEPGSDGTLDYAGSEFGPVSATVLDPASLGAPATTKVVSVRMPVTPVDEVGASCLPPVLSEQGRKRQWNEQSHRLEGLGRLTISCQADATADPYIMDLHYVLPVDATGWFAIEVSSPNTLPGYASFPIEIP